MDALRAFLRENYPDAEECISYRMPGYRLRGKMIAGYAVFKNHLGFFPHSGQVLKEIPILLEGYTISGKGAGIHLPWGQPIPFDLLRTIIDIRIAQAFA